MSALSLRSGARLGQRATRVVLEPGLVRMDADEVARTLVEPQRAVPRLDAAVTIDDSPADGALVLLPAGELAWLPAEVLRDAGGPGLARVARPVAALAVVVRTCWVAYEPAEAATWALDHVDAEYVYLRRGNDDFATLYRALPEDVVATANDVVWRAVCPSVVVDASHSPSAWEAFVQRFFGDPGELPGVRNAERWGLNLGAPEAAVPSTPSATDEPAAAPRARGRAPVPVRTVYEPITDAPALERRSAPNVSPPAPPAVPGSIMTSTPSRPSTMTPRAVQLPAEVYPMSAPEPSRTRATSLVHATPTPTLIPDREPPVAREPDVVAHLERHPSQDGSQRPATSDPGVVTVAPVTAPRPLASLTPTLAAPVADLHEPAPTPTHQRTRTTDEPKVRAAFATRPPANRPGPLQRELPGRATPGLDTARYDAPRRDDPRPSPWAPTSRHDALSPISEAPPSRAASVTTERAAARRGEPVPARDYRVGSATVELGVVVVSLGERDERSRDPGSTPTRRGAAAPTRTGSLLAEIPVGRRWRSEL